jgi:hypothetical protein
LGLTALFEVEEGKDEPGRYFVYLNRSRSLDLRGFFGESSAPSSREESAAD